MSWHRNGAAAALAHLDLQLRIEGSDIEPLAKAYASSTRRSALQAPRLSVRRVGMPGGSGHRRSLYLAVGPGADERRSPRPGENA